MFKVVVKNKKFHHDVSELLKVFVDKSEFIITDDHVENPTLKDMNKQNNGIQSLDEFHSINFEDCQNDKQELKRNIYLYFSKIIKYEPPWGILTGIRPTKIVNELFNQGKNKEEIITILKQEYLIKDHKVNLLLKATENQRYINQQLRENSVSIYIGIPFCPSRCSYCSFTSYEISEKASSQYLIALFREIDYVLAETKKRNIIVESVYVGGGTPTSLSNKDFEAFISFLSSKLDFKTLKEFTVEAGRPDTINEEKLNILIENNCTRISINPQSMNDKTLVNIGRKHSAELLTDTYQLIKKFHFDVINMDIIAGLPGEDIDDFENTLDQVVKLNPDNITIHNLAIKKTAKLKSEHIANDDTNKQKADLTIKMLELSYDKMSENGYEPYYLYRQKDMLGNLENIGYSKKGKEGIYNVRIMEENQTIIAMGASGVSKVYFPSENRLERIPNVSNYEIYIERIDEMIERKKRGIFAFIPEK